MHTSVTEQRYSTAACLKSMLLMITIGCVHNTSFSFILSAILRGRAVLSLIFHIKRASKTPGNHSFAQIRELRYSGGSHTVNHRPPACAPSGAFT